MLKSHLQKWFKNHPAISIRKFALECGYAPVSSTFQVWLKRKAMRGEKVTPAILHRISPVLRRYGYDFDEQKEMPELKIKAA